MSKLEGRARAENRRRRVGGRTGGAAPLPQFGGPAGILGFSQGAILAGVVAAESHARALPPLRFAVLVAGRKPRADALRPLFDTTIMVPSLHVCGDRDLMTPPALGIELAEAFDPTTREILRWPGPHVIPTRGPAAMGILDFVRRWA